MWLQYPSSIEQIVEQNESFDSCVIKICYTGKNRNRSSISKEAIEAAIPSIYNCPIVCNYNIDEDTIGGHDIEVVSTNNGMRLINLTDAVGVIPSNCKYYWETITDNDVEHEYLCVEAILWKRSSAYSKIKRDGIVSQSMEITVKNGQSVDGYYQIDEFIFTAFCLLGDDVEPCFESASLETFSLERYKQTFSDMMADFKEYFSKFSLPDGVEINTQNLSKGGNIPLDKNELLAEYGLTVDELDFNIDDFSVDELKIKFDELKEKNAAEGSAEPTANGQENFSLTGEQLTEQLCEALSNDKYEDPCWGLIRKYSYVDHDYELSEVYCYDCEENWKLYGFPYSMNGDNVVIDFEAKKRKKISIVDFDEGDIEPEYKYAFETYANSVSKFKDGEIANIQAEAEEKYSQISASVVGLQSELSELREYKNAKTAEEKKNAQNEIFARFTELDGIEAFDNLRENCDDMSLEDIESKCFEIKGRNVMTNFSVNKSKSTRIQVEKKFENEPYGGLFVQYPPTNN